MLRFLSVFIAVGLHFSVFGSNNNKQESRFDYNELKSTKEITVFLKRMITLRKNTCNFIGIYECFNNKLNTLSFSELKFLKKVIEKMIINKSVLEKVYFEDILAMPVSEDELAFEKIPLFEKEEVLKPPYDILPIFLEYCSIALKKKAREENLSRARSYTSAFIQMSKKSGNRLTRTSSMP